MCIRDRFEMFADGQVWATKEYRSNSGDDIAVQHRNLMLAGMAGMGYIDPTAAVFRVYLKERGTPVRDAQAKPVHAGITLTRDVLASRKLLISERCPELIKEMHLYAWDENKPDVPIKKNDHGCDALRYGVMAHFRRKYGRKVIKFTRDVA